MTEQEDQEHDHYPLSAQTCLLVLSLQTMIPLRGTEKDTLKTGL